MGHMRQKITGYLFVMPAIVILGWLIVLPLCRAIWYSLLSWDGVGPSRFVGAQNYQQIFSQSIERGSLYNALILFVFFCLIPTGLGLIAVGLLGRGQQRSNAVFRVILFLPQVLVTVVVAIVWTWLMAPFGTGTINGLLHAVGLGPVVGPSWLGGFSTALGAIGVIAVWLDVGLCFVLFLAGVQRIPADLYDAARIDGAGMIREFIHVTVPLLRREIGAAITITAVAGLGSFTLVFEATNGGPGNATVIPGLLVYRDAFTLGDVGGATALGVSMAVIIFVITFGIRWGFERRAV